MRTMRRRREHPMEMEFRFGFCIDEELLGAD
jgi:hypothetical protein